MESKIEMRGQGGFRTRDSATKIDFPSTAIPKVFLRSDIRERQTRLEDVIRDQIVPKLQLIHHEADQAGATRPFADEEIAEFGVVAMGREAAASIAYFERMRAKGHSLENMFAHFLAPTARHLGALWEQDRCDFVDVTLGVARLQELLELFGSASEKPLIDRRHRALLIAAPGERHMFGVDMVAELMRAAGWEVHVEKGLDVGQNAAAVATEWFGVVGVTASGEAGLDGVARIIEHVRRSSANRAVGVMVGGPAFANDPELVARVGADASAADAPSAVILAKKLLMLQAEKA